MMGGVRVYRLKATLQSDDGKTLGSKASGLFDREEG